MKKEESDIDALIREALDEEQAEIYDRLGEPTVPEMLGTVLRGRNRFLTALSIIGTTVFFVLGIYAIVRFLGTEDLREMLIWIAAFFFCLTAVLANKIWHWMELQRIALAREIKRLELQVAHLASTIRRHG